jgi:hypothetical protein
MERPAWMSQREWDEASERGRQVAASHLAQDFVARARMETQLGEEFCRARWPEAYKENGESHATQSVQQHFDFGTRLTGLG